MGLLAWMIFAWQPGGEQGRVGTGLDLATVPQGGEFTLRSWRGPVALEDCRGKGVLLYFGYTWCPDVCPTNLGYIAMALDRLSEAERDQSVVLFVSVDPGRDTPERLRDYTGFFHPGIIGLTGSPAEVARVAALYGAAYRKTEQTASAAGYLVDHSVYTYLIDREGRLRGALDHATPPEQIASALRSLLESSDLAVHSPLGESR
jgi:protein SCO1/2